MLKTRLHRTALCDGFTLVELLVVVTIIVVLLALLSPAVEKAIYQAEWTLCAANLDAISTGGMGYAAENKRAYPRPPTLRGPNWQPDTLGRGNTPAQDLRRVIANHIGVKTLQCPMTGKIDMRLEGNRPETWVYATYDLWYGFRYNTTAAGPQKGMFRLGDRFTWGGNSFKLLACDKNLVNDVDGGNGLSHSSHPDRDNVLVNEAFQDAWDGGGAMVGDTIVAGNRLTASRWWDRSTSLNRGALDLNFAFDDGSVIRYNDVNRRDKRLEAVPAFDNDAAPNYDLEIPPAD